MATEPTIPKPRDERFAALDARLESALRNAGDQTTAVVVGDGDSIELSAETLKTLHKVVHGLASDTELTLTTTEAADFLGVSRPYLTRLFKAGEIPYRKIGNRHLVPTTGLTAIREVVAPCRRAPAHLRRQRHQARSLHDPGPSTSVPRGAR